jgi:methionine-rich copper-binding protein CopC
MRRAAAVLAAALTAVLVTTAPAEAHTTLTSSDPKKGATVTSPRQIQLTFGDPVRFTGVVVLDAKGGHHESGKSQAVDNHVTEQVAGVLVPGVYTVGWRVVAPDGHPVTGEYTFTVKGGGGAASPAPSSSAAAPSAGPATTPAAESSKPASSAGWWWIGLGILVVALAGGGLALVRRRG